MKTMRENIRRVSTDMSEKVTPSSCGWKPSIAEQALRAIQIVFTYCRRALEVSLECGSLRRQGRPAPKLEFHAHGLQLGGVHELLAPRLQHSPEAPQATSVEREHVRQYPEPQAHHRANRTQLGHSEGIWWSENETEHRKHRDGPAHPTPSHVCRVAYKEVHLGEFSEQDEGVQVYTLA